MTSNRPKIKDGFVCIHCKEPFPFPNYNRKTCFDCKKKQMKVLSAKMYKLKKSLNTK